MQVTFPKLSTLIPTVKATGDRNVFLVVSRHTGEFKWTVDMESNAGLGRCNCPDFEKNKNRNCWHIVQCRYLIATAAMHSVIKLYGIREKN